MRRFIRNACVPLAACAALAPARLSSPARHGVANVLSMLAARARRNFAGGAHSACAKGGALTPPPTMRSGFGDPPIDGEELLLTRGTESGRHFGVARDILTSALAVRACSCRKRPIVWRR